MKQLLLLLCFFSIGNLMAQPVLHSNEMAGFGTKWTMYYTNSTQLMDTTIQGTGATWDFTGVQPLSQYYTSELMDPAQTPYASTFPDANYVYLEGPAVAYRYFKLTNSTLERVGSWSSSSGIKTYSDSQVEYVFPFQVGSYNFDTWANSASSSGGTYELECIGSGTLELPMGTFHDVIMVRARAIEFFLDLTAYYWYDTNNGIFLVQYVIGDGVFVPTLATYATEISFPAGINEPGELEVVNFTNPVEENLTLFLGDQDNASYTYEIINIMGQVVSLNEIQAEDSVVVPMGHLDEGIYFLRLTDKYSGATTTVKIVKV